MAVERSKARYWAEAKRKLTPLEALRIGDELRRQVELLRPDWPTPEERAEDVATHARVSAMLRSVRS